MPQINLWVNMAASCADTPLPGDAFFIMCPDPGHGGGGRGGVTAPNCLEASQIGTLGQKKWHWDTWTKMIKNCLNMTLWGVSVLQKSCFFWKKKNQRQHRRNKAQKEVRKSEFSLELIFCIVKTENRALQKDQKFDGNFKSKTRILENTSELEAQYMNLF